MTTRARKMHPSQHGFTLVELMVAMVAGLIVALSVVGLSHEASNTFHEETRIAATEMQLRGAIDRLRADVERAGFMSTGNIFIDTNILTTPGTTTNVNAAVYGAAPASYQNAGGTHMSLYDLAGIRLFSGGSNLASMPLTGINFGSAPKGPDAIEIGGNMTGVEVLSIGAPAGQGLTAVMAGGNCGTQRIYLDVLSTPALWRLVGMSPTGSDAIYSQALMNAFEPVNPTNNGGVGASFIVRIVDNTTHKTQYAATCPTWAPANSATLPWNANGAIAAPYIDLDKNSNITLPGINPNATINPVQIVRWQIQPTVINSAAADATKYDLTRQFIDAYGNPVGTPETIAEYAVDLKFAFTIDMLGNTTGNYVGLGNSPLLVNSLEDGSNTVVTNQTVAGDVSGSVPGGATAVGPFPQRIRSVRMRLVTRSAMQDRTEPLTPPVIGGAANPYLYRYCLASSTAACNPVATTPPTLVPAARTRTLISEVSLPNQARLWFQ